MTTEDVKKVLTRQQTSRRLGCSVATLQYFERRGRLTPEHRLVRGRSVVHYPLEEVEKLHSTWKPRRTNPDKVKRDIARTNRLGPLASKVFQLFAQANAQGRLRRDRDAVMREIVVAADVDPLLVAELYKEWDLAIDGRRRQEELKKVEDEIRREEAQREREARRQFKLRLAEIAAKAKSKEP